MMVKKILALAVAAAMACSLAGCAGGGSGAGTGGASSSSSGGKTTVSLMFYNNLDAFKALVESTYDDIQLDYEQSTLAKFNSDEVRRVKNGHGHDLVLTSMPTGDIKDYVADLSAYDFSTRYESSIMSRVKQDGKTLYLPLPSNYFGFVVNKTLVEQMGLALPTTQQELLDLLRTAKETGVGRSEEGFVISTNNVDGTAMGNLIVGAEVPDFLGTAQGEKWLADFLENKATFAGTWEDGLAFFLTLTNEGFMDVERLNGSRNVVDVMGGMAKGDLIACFGSSLYLDTIRAEDTDYEFVMLPFLSSASSPAWALSDPAACISINKAVEESGDAAKMDACVRVLDLLSTPEGQQAVMQDMRADSSYLSDDVPSAKSGVTGLEDVIEGGYTYSNRLPANVVWKLGVDAVKAAAGKMTPDEVLADVDEFHRAGPQEAAEDHVIVGGVADDLLFEDFNTRKGETALGNLVADAVAEASGAPIAFANGGGIRASLYAGDVYRSDLAVVVPFDNTIVVLDVDGKTLKELLANSITQIRYTRTPGGRFLQVHGLSYEVKVDPSVETEKEPVAAELVSVTLPDGSPVDDAATYRIAVNNYMCGSQGYADNTGDGFTMLNVFDSATPAATGAKLVEDTGKTYADALEAYFDAHESEEITAKVEGRIKVEGAPA
ncbi:5'-nucleotidase C-terminal domain-containing protein [Arabiibacter massiliensis]|uniref:5'-nucleotidase C-terminal domain-containing protein n=1 Tax=Arabiibacter massiliensis TaxID=1870985 RepID=UPI0009B9D943|nr:5'-nucleotidase C-terminal domain-containing protein [Arabiibacter massiliensis]